MIYQNPIQWYHSISPFLLLIHDFYRNVFCNLQALQSKEKAVLRHSELSNSLRAVEEENRQFKLEIVELQKQVL